MAVSLGQLLLELGLDTTAFRSQMESAKLQSAQLGQDIEKNLRVKVTIDPTTAQNSFKRTADVLGKPLVIKVDDSSLTALNKHLDLKQKHWAETQRTFSKPIAPSVDTSEIDRLEQRLRNLSRINATPSVGARSSSGQSQTQNVKASVDTNELGGAIEKAFGNALKGMKSGGIGSVIMAPIKAVTGMIAQIVGGGLQGIGMEISRDIGSGLRKGIEGELGSLIGSFSLLGETLGKGLTDELLDIFASEIEGIKPIVEAVIGKEQVVIANAAQRGKRSKARRTDREVAQDQIQLENDFLEKNMPAVRERIDNARSNRQEYNKKKQVIDKKIEKKASDLGLERLQEQLEQLQKELSEVQDSITSESSPAQVKSANDRTKRISDRRNSITNEIKQVKRSAREFYQPQLDILARKDEALGRDERSIDRMISPMADVDIVGVSDRAQKENQKKQRTKQSENLPSLYRNIAMEVAKMSGQEMTPDMIPQIVASEQYKGFQQGSYNAKSNVMNVSPEALEGIKSGQMNSDTIELLVHELRHGAQAGFGDRAKAMSGSGYLKPDVEEKKKLGGRIEASTESGGGSESKRSVRKKEMDAYVFADRNAGEIAERVKKTQALEQFEDKLGVGGGKAKIAMVRGSMGALGKIQKFNSIATADMQEEMEAAIAQIDKLRKFVDDQVDSLGDLDLLGTEEIHEAQKRIELLIGHAVEKIVAETETFKQAVIAKPEKLRSNARDTMQTMSKRKDLVPIANQLGIEDASKLSKKQLIAQISQSENVQGMSDAVMGASRQRAQEMQRRQDAIQDAKFKAMEVAERTGRFARGTVNASNAAVNKATEIAQSPAVQQAASIAGRAIVQGAQMIGSMPIAQNALNAGKQGARAIGGAAKLGYRAIEATESLVLDALPMGRTAKAVGKNLVLPAAGYVAATHMLPGGAAIAGGLEHLVGGALNPLIQGAGANVAQGAANMLGHALPNVMGIQQAVSAGVVNLIQQGTNAAAGGAVEAMSLALGGRILATTGGRAIGAAGNVVQNVLQPTQLNPRLQLPEASTAELQAVSIASTQKALTMSLEAVESSLIETSQKVGKALEDAGSEVSEQLEYALSKINEPIPSPQTGSQKKSKPRSTETPDIEVLGYDPKVVAGAGISNAKATAEQLRGLKKKLQQSIKEGNAIVSRQIYDELEQSAERALKGLTGLADGLYAEGSMGSDAGNKINNAKAQISRARNDARRLMRKAPQMRSAAIDEDDALMGFGSIEDFFRRKKPSTRSLSEIEQDINPVEVSDATVKRLRDQLNRGRKVRGRRKKAPQSSSQSSVFEQSEADYTAANVGFDRAAGRFDRTASRINHRYDRSMSGLGEAQPETLVSRIRRIASANFNQVRERFDDNGATSGFLKIAGAGKIALGVLGGFTAIGFIGPMLLGIGNDATKAALEFERFKRVINFTSGGEFKGAQNLKEIRDEANRLGVDMRASIAGFSQFSASTKETPLEGDASTRIFKNVTQASANYGLDNQAQERVFMALSQMSSKGVVSMEELRQQLGESLPGALNVAARSMGMTTKEFSKMVENGEVLASDFLPKFAQQLGAESASGVAGASKSTQASLNRLNNTLYDLQVTVGTALLPLQKFNADMALQGIQALIRVLEFLLKILPAVAAVFSVQFVGGLMAGSGVMAGIGPLLATIGTKLLALLPAIAAFATKFLIFQGIIDIFGMVGKAMSDQGGKFREFANSSAQSLREYQDALNEANKAQQDFTQNMPKNSNELKGDSLLGDTIVGTTAKFIAGDAGKSFVERAERKVQKTLGLRTNAENQADNRTVAMNELIGNRSQRRLDIVQQIKGPNSVLKQQTDIDRQIETIQAKRRGLAVTSPDNKEALRSLKREEDELLGKREGLLKPIASLQQGNAQDIEAYKNSIKELKTLAKEGKITQSEYTEKMGAFQAALQGAEKDQEALEKALKSTITPLEKFEKAWDRITAKLEDASIAMKKSADSTRLSIANAELNDGATRGQSERKTELMQQDQLREKIKANRDAIAQMRGELEANDIGTVKTNYGITDSMGPSEIKSIAAKVTQPKEKALLERLSELNQMESEIGGYEADLAESLVSAKRKLKDSAKSVDDFFRTIARQAQEAALEAKSMQLEINGLKAKNKLKAALTRMNDSYIGEYVDGLVGLVDQMQEPFKLAIENQKAQLGKVNALNDTLRQAQELGQSLPTGGEIGGMGGTVDAGAGGDSGGEPSSGAFKSGLFSGPSHRIGGSSEYHIDTKVSRDLSWKQIVEMFDQMAAAYRSQGRKIEFSNAAVAGLVYNEKQEYQAKEQMLKKAFEAHHSQGRDINNGVRSIDYYLPKISGNRFDSSVEGVEVMLPNLPGAKLDYASGGGYGNYVNISDANGKYLMSTGHGDNAKALPKDRTISASPRQARNTIASTGRGGAPNLPGLNAKQRSNVAAIVEQGRKMGLDKNQIAGIVAGAMQESRLGMANDEVGGYGGKGLFQLTDEPGQSGTWIGKGGIKSLKDYYDPGKNVRAIMEDYRFNEWKKTSKGMSPTESATAFARIVLRPESVGDKYADKARQLFPDGSANVLESSRSLAQNTIAPTARQQARQQQLPATPQRTVVIPYDHARGRVPDRTGGNTFNAAGATGASYAGQTERDFQDLAIPDFAKKLKAQGYRVIEYKPENFKSYEEYDAAIKKQSQNPNTVVIPYHLDAKGGSALTRVRAGDAQDAKLGNSLLTTLRNTVKSAKVTGQDTQGNATVNVASAAPAALIEIGAMADFIDRYGTAGKFIRSAEGQNVNQGLVTGVNNFFGGAPRGRQRPANTIMPTTGMAQGQIQSLETQSQGYSDLQSRIGQGTDLATQTTNQSIALANELTKQKQISAKIDADRQARRSRRQLKQGGSDQQDQTTGLTQEIENLERSLGPDTPNKALKNQLQDIKRNRVKLGKDLDKNEEKVNDALADLKAALPEVEKLVSQGLIPQANLDALKQQIPLLEQQVKQNAANRTKYNALDKKLIDDLKEKFNEEQKGREFSRDQELSGQQIAERRSQAEKLRTKASQEFTGPADRKKAENESLRLSYEADKAERKNRLDADLKALADKARNDPQTYDAKTIAESQKRLYAAAGQDFERLTQNYKNATQILTTTESQRQRELETGLKQSELDRARQQAQAASDTVNRLSQFGGVRTGDLQATTAQSVFDAGKAELDFSLEQFKQQQEELIRSGKATREEADKAIAAFERLNQVKLSDLQSQLQQTQRAAQFSDIEIGKQEADRLRAVADRSSPFSLEGLQMRRKSAQDILDLTKQEVELRAQAFREEQESLVARKLISREMADKAIGRMEQSKRMKIEDADYQFQQSTRDANRTYDDARYDVGRMQISSRTGLRSAQAGYASAYGFDYQAKQFQKANAIDEQKMKYMDASREIDRLAEAGGKLEKSPEIVAQLRTNLESLNTIELNTINAQFNPLVDGLKSVKGAFQGFLGDVIVGNMSIEEAFDKMIENVLNSLAQLAAQLITEQLFGAIFGLGGGGGMFGGGGGGGGILGSIFGFASGGDVPTVDHSAMRDRPDSIGRALRTEGPNSVLATLTPGEKVLSVAQTQRYHAMGLDRFVESGARTALASAQRSESFGRIFQFNAGGIVPGGAAIPTPKIQNGGETINIPININSEGGGKPSIDTNRMNDAVRNAVIQEIRRQKRPNGELN